MRSKHYNLGDGGIGTAVLIRGGSVGELPEGIMLEDVLLLFAQSWHFSVVHSKRIWHLLKNRTPFYTVMRISSVAPFTRSRFG